MPCHAVLTCLDARLAATGGRCGPVPCLSRKGPGAPPPKQGVMPGRRGLGAERASSHEATPSTLHARGVFWSDTRGPGAKEAALSPLVKRHPLLLNLGGVSLPAVHGVPPAWPRRSVP